MPFEFDFSKSYLDPLEERPGHQHLNLKHDGSDLPGIGDKQTPINLNTNIEILENFQDDEFEFEYNPIDPVAVKKYNEMGQQYQFILKQEEDYMKTQTIGLFDEHLNEKPARFYGMQAHMHAPSEHTIDGQMLDLELHVVHGLDPELLPDKKGGSQFSNAVLGFLFKVVPDSYFKTHDDFHDKFLWGLAQDYKEGRPADKLDLTDFIKRLNNECRWTYNGSLTTAPFAEGILWNVLEDIIPIRQSTLDELVSYKEIEEARRFNRYESPEAEKAFYEKQKKDGLPDHVVPHTTEDGKTLFRLAFCNRPVQDQGDRPVYRIDVQN